MKISIKSTIKKTVFAIAMLISCHTAFSQDCVLKVDKTDKFTGETFKELEPVLLLKTHKEGKTVKISDLSMILKIEGDNKIFTLMFSRKGKGIPTFNLMMGNKLILLLDNGDQVELPMTGGMTSDYIKLEMFTHFKVSDENLQVLCRSNITDVRVVSMTNPFDFKVDETVNTVPFFNCLDSQKKINEEMPTMANKA